MKRAATISIAMTLVTMNLSVSLAPAMAQGFLGDLVKDTLDTTAGVVRGAAGIVGGTVQGAANVVGGTVGLGANVVSGTANVLTGTVDATGSVIDASGRVVGRVLVGPSTTTVVPTTGTTTVYTFGSGNDVFTYSLDTRISDLRAAVSAAESSGKLTAVQAAGMRAELDRIASTESSLRSDNVFTFNEATTLAQDLDRVNTNLASTLSVRPFRQLVVVESGTPRLFVTNAVPVAPSTVRTTTTTGVIPGVVNGLANVVTGTVNSAGDVINAAGEVVGSVLMGTSTTTPDVVTSRRTIVMGNSTTVFGSMLDSRATELNNAISAAQISGKLTATQAADLQANLTATTNALSADRASSGVLSFDEAVARARDLDAVASRMNTFLGTTQFSPIVVMRDGSPRIYVSTQSQSTTASISPSARASVSTANVAPIVSTYVGSTVSGSPVNLLPVLETRRYDLDRLVAQAVARRVITPTEAAVYTGDLIKIGNTLFTARTSSTLTNDELLTWSRSLDDLNDRIAAAVYAAPFSPLTVLTGGTPRLAGDLFTNVISLNSIEGPVFVTTLDARRSAIESMLSSGLSSGTISSQQAAIFRTELDRIAKLQGETGSSLTYTTALPLAVDLDLLGARIHNYVPTTTFVPLISNNRIALAGGRVAVVDEVTVRRAEIAARIDRERILGRLTTDEASRLKSSLNEVGSREARMRTDGVLTYSEAQTLFAELDRVMDRLNTFIAGRRQTVSVK